MSPFKDDPIRQPPVPRSLYDDRAHDRDAYKQAAEQLIEQYRAGSAETKVVELPEGESVQDFH